MVYLPSHDLHVHTVHCGHAEPDATAANLVGRAAELGLSCLGFAEHVIFAEQVGVLDRVRADLAHVKMPPGIRVLIGVEIDADPIHLDGRWVADPGPVDYAILSPHLVPEYGVGHWAFPGLGLSEREARRIGRVWLDWYEACITRGGMQILGHPLREPVNLGMLTLRDTGTLARAEDILRRAAADGVAFELNNGWVLRLLELGELEAYAGLVRRLREAGMRFACGSDAHAVAHLGGRDGIALLAEAAGLTPADWLDPDDLAGR